MATLTTSPGRATSSFDDAIDLILDNNTEMTTAADEYNSWLAEPAWTAAQYKSGCTAVQYWLQLRPKYPNLSQLALEVITIPASRANCKRVFLCTGQFIEPQRRKIGSQLLTALICTQRWIQIGFQPLSAKSAAIYNDQQLNKQF